MNNSGFYLDFERDLVELQKKIDELKSQAEADGLNLDEGVRKLEAQAAKKRREIYANLSSWQRVQIARHPNRRTRSIMSSGCSQILPSYTAIAFLPTTPPSSAGRRG